MKTLELDLGERSYPIYIGGALLAQYLLLTAAAWVGWGPNAALLYLLSLPPSGILSLFYLERLLGRSSLRPVFLPGARRRRQMRIIFLFSMT